MTMTRILLVNTVASGGGAARMARTLHEGLGSKAGFQSLLAVGRGPTRAPDVVRITSRGEVGLHLLLTRVTGLQGFGSPLASRRLIDLIHSWQPDLIHFHNVHGYYLDLNFLNQIHRSEWHGPIVWTLHDAWAFTGRCSYFFQCDRWQKGCGQCPDLARYPKTLFDSSRMMWKKKRAAFTTLPLPTLVSPSQWLADAVASSFLGRAETRVIPNGIDTEHFRPRRGTRFRQRHDILRDRPIVLFAASSLGVKRKGGSLAAEAMQNIARNDSVVITVGAQDASLPQGPSFRHLGYLDNPDDVAEAFGAANLFCILSLDENFPTTVLESLASGTPVVGFAVGGIVEQITPACGRLLEPGDVDSMIRVVQGLCRDRPSLAKMAEHARRRACQEYSLSTFLRRHVELYDHLLSRPVKLRQG